MDEYIELSAAIEAAKHAWAKGLDPSQYIESLPAADVAPVVRCKECEHAERYERIDGTAGYYCGHPQNTFTYGERWDRVFKPVKEADDFCSRGERKDNKNEH